MELKSPKRVLTSRPITFISEIPTKKLSVFWDGLEKGIVYASKCGKCGKVSFPPVADCSRCLTSEQEYVKLEGDGEIETYTHIMIRPASFRHSEAYTVAIAKMKEGVKVLAWVADSNPEDVQIGAKVRIVAKKSEAGPTYAFNLYKD